MGNLAIIPARRGSKRIPLKNIKDFLGKPIIAYSIELALKSGLFDEVMVSTDDQEIADIAISYGAKVPFFRSESNADDFATTIDVLNEVVEKYAEENLFFEYVCCIYATSPLSRPLDLQAGLSMLKNNDYDSVFPVVPFSTPIWRAFEVKNQQPVMLWPEYKNSRSQDLKEVYHDAGQWYWYNPKKIGSSLFSENSGTIILPERHVQDIDSIDDWRLAETKYILNNEQ